MDDHDDDFFSGRSSEYKRVQEEKQAALDHCATEHDKLKSKKKGLIEQKEQIETRNETELNEATKLLCQLGGQATSLSQLEAERTELISQQLQRRETIAQELTAIYDEPKSAADLECELEQQTAIRNELDAEQQKLTDLKYKEAENANAQNYLQLSLKALQERIAQARRTRTENGRAAS